MTPSTIAAAIDHTNLSPTATPDDIRRLCEEAMEYSFASVCVNPCYVSLAAELLSASEVKVCTVIGFPLGMNTSNMKTAEAKQAIADGAHELDIVINQGALKSGNTLAVYDEILTISDLAGKRTVKVILETCNLTDDEIKTACELSVRAGATFVKTSTGFGSGGANVRDVRLMKQTVGEAAEVKASGGIKTYGQALDMIAAGATRIGTSAGVAIVKEASV